MPPRRSVVAASAAASSATSKSQLSASSLMKKKKSITRKGKSQSQKKRTRGQCTDNQKEEEKEEDSDKVMKATVADEDESSKVTTETAAGGSRAKKRTKRVAAENHTADVTSVPSPVASPSPSSHHLHNDAISSILAFLDAKDFESSLTVSRHWYSAAQLRTSWPQTFSLSQYIPAFHHLSASLTMSPSPSSISTSTWTRMIEVRNTQLYSLSQSRVYSNLRDLSLIVYYRTSIESIAHLSHLSALTALDVRIDKDQLPALASALDSIKSHILVLKCHLSPPEVPFSLTSFGILLQLRVLCIHSSREVNSIAIVQLHSLEYFQGPDSDNETPELVYALRYLSVYHSLRHLNLIDFTYGNTGAFWQPVKRSFDGHPIEDLPVTRLRTIAVGSDSAEGVFKVNVHDLCEIECLARMKLYFMLGMDDNEYTIGPSLSPESVSALKNIAHVESLLLDIRLDADQLTNDLGQGLTRWTSLRHLHIKFDYHDQVNFTQLLPFAGFPFLEQLSIQVDEDLPDVSFDISGYDALASLPSLQQLTLHLPSGRFPNECFELLFCATKSLQHFERFDLELHFDDHIQFPPTSFNSLVDQLKFHSLHIHLRGSRSSSETHEWWNRLVGSSSHHKFELPHVVLSSLRVQQFRIFLHTEEEEDQYLTSIYRVDCTSQLLKWINCANEARRHNTSKSSSIVDIRTSSRWDRTESWSNL